MATATLVVAANAPDIDVLSFLVDPYFALAFRRGVTHGWSALIVLPFLVAGAMLAWDAGVRRRLRPEAEPARPGPTLALAIVGVLTHPTLDWMNSYGMRWGLPFDGSWSYGDALFIIDPWIWLVLAGAVFLSSRPGRVGLGAWATLAALATALVGIGMPSAFASWAAGSAAIIWLYRTGRPAAPSARRALARGALAAVAVYIAALVALDGVATTQVRGAAEAAGLSPTDVMVAPERGRLLRSAVEVRTADGFVPGSHRWLASPRVELDPDALVPLVDRPTGVTSDMAEEVVARASRIQAASDYLVWSRYPYVRLRREGDLWHVRFADARYDDEPGAGSLAGVDVTVPSEPGS